MDRRISGKLGEDIAFGLYKKMGYDIAQQNYKTPYGEIDLIAQNEAYIVFCEVKTRRTLTYGSPAQAVTAKKRRHIIDSANYYLQSNLTSKQPRFDVCEVYFDLLKGIFTVKETQIIENAFGDE